MKLLIALNLLQAAGIAILIVLLAGNGSTALPPAGAVAAGDDVAVHRVQEQDSSCTTCAPDDDRLRRIIREELALHADRDFARPVQAITGAGERNAEEDVYRKEFVDRQIEYYRTAGAISDREMQDLQREMARLGPAARREAMSRLVRAMNSGEIKGRL